MVIQKQKYKFISGEIQEIKLENQIDYFNTVLFFNHRGIGKPVNLTLFLKNRNGDIIDFRYKLGTNDGTFPCQLWGYGGLESDYDLYSELKIISDTTLDIDIWAINQVGSFFDEPIK